IDIRLGDDVLLRLIVDDGKRLFRLGDNDAVEDPAALECDQLGLEAWRDRAARLEDRFDDVDLGETAGEPGQVGTNAFALVAEAMAFDALRFLGIEKELPAPFRIAGARQGGASEALMLRRGTLPAKTQRKLAKALGAGELD